MTAVSVILPTFKEAENILNQIAVIDRELAGHDYEILVVDDNSPDGTADIVRNAMPGLPHVRLILRTENKGLVNSIRDGIGHAAGEICIWMDADLSMPATALKPLLSEIDAGADLAVGSRYVKGGGIKGADHRGEGTPLHRIWLNLLSTEDSFVAVAISKYGNKFAKSILNKKYHDYTSGFYAVRRSVLDDIGLQGNYVEYCISLLCNAGRRGYKISEIPVVIVAREKGESKTSTNFFTVIPIAWRCLKTIIRLMRER